MNRRRNPAAGKYRSLYETSLGTGAVVASEAGVLEVFLPFDGKGKGELLAEMSDLYPLALAENRVTREAAELLRRYFAGERVLFAIPLDLGGCTEFQTAVYEVVAAIPYGAARTYGEVAARLGRPQAARGVGSAMAANRLPIVIPCHRVVGAAGALTGYSAPGGVASKKWLLEMEQGKTGEF
ncbi:methylated-DNA--[protein]-cysteine S-methyltransferase [Geobacter sp. AOG1]|uniref:methylated-DNA--[protein]-cysteine S-methyltransferase n=1 Tax=Geobacter sp. AOG1 TaxID=1566346 RepID=UPI001CC43B9B|nr:methylated-DNA--[protein]-cysteine S-methyltransferase [Geobacter sp. AOG1]GFE59164.1 methylated-DNA-protein-cysteinemethyltransferase [Geobacter sp. AOG1]